MTTALACERLPAYPTSDAVTALPAHPERRWARVHRLSEARIQELWELLQPPPRPVSAPVVRAPARLRRTLVAPLTPVVAAVGDYRKAVNDCFARIPAAQWTRTLPIGDHGITAPTLWHASRMPPDRGRRFGIGTRRRRRCR